MKRSHSHIPSGVWVLGFVSMLMDISSEMIHSLLPLFMVTTLGASTIALRAQQGGIPIALVPLVMVAMNLVYALSAYPFGKLSDTMSHTRLLVLGLIVLIATDVVLAINNYWGIVLLGVVLWGLHMGMTQGLLAAMVADASPADLRGTAYGFFNLACGLALLIASALAGVVWEQFSAPFTFYVGASCGACAIALVVYVVYKESQPSGV